MRQGKAWLGKVRRDRDWHGQAWIDYYGGILRSATYFKRTTGNGLVRNGVLRRGVARLIKERQGMARSGPARCGMARQGRAGFLFISILW